MSTNIDTIRSLLDKTNVRADQVKQSQQRRKQSKLTRLNAIESVVVPTENTWIKTTIEASEAESSSDNDYYNEVIEQGVSDDDFINDLVGDRLDHIVSEKDWD